MSSIEHQMTEIYCFVDDALKANLRLARWRHSPNSHPNFTDAEVITIALMQGCLGVATLKKAYLLLAFNHHRAFPHLVSYKQWIARLHALTEIIGHLFTWTRADWSSPLSCYLIDSKPIPVCKPIRHQRVRLLREDGAYWARSSCGWFFGFKLHLLMSIKGRILSALLTPANFQDRAAAPALGLATDGGILLGDLGYRGAATAQIIAQETDLLVITPSDGGSRRALISSIRERIETLFSQLWNKFIDRVFSRSWNGLWNTIKLKLLNYNLCQAGLISA
jgi:hypothetical protein